MFTGNIAPLVVLLGFPAALASQGISEILTKTGDINHAKTNDNVTMQVCNMKGRCCTTVLDDPDVNDREQGNLDTYTSGMIGDCSDSSFYGDLTVTLTKDKSNGWFVEWAEIKFDESRSYTCMFNTWLDDSVGYTNSVTANCDEDRGVSAILAKTDSRRHADTDDNISMEVCDGSGNCCTSVLDNENVNDRKKGAVDKYSDPEVLGECFNKRMKLKSQLTATLSKDGHDGWYAEWAQIRFAWGRSFTCVFDNWLDDSGSYSNSMTVECNEDQGVSEISTKTGSVNHAGTDDEVSIKICNESGNCCTTTLDDPDEDDRKKGHVDFFSDPADLGSCLNTKLEGDLTATLEKDGTDGWYVEWAQIMLATGRSFTCQYNLFLDTDPGFSNSKSVQCTEDQGVVDIWVKTSSRSWADTNDKITIKVCDSATNCCEVDLDNPSKNDRKRSALDKYSDPDMLGSCFNTKFEGDLSVTLSKDGSNGWYVDYATIYLAQMNSFTCDFNIWLDNENGHTRSETVQCGKD